MCIETIKYRGAFDFGILAQKQNLDIIPAVGECTGRMDRLYDYLIIYTTTAQDRIRTAAHRVKMATPLFGFHCA